MATPDDIKNILGSNEKVELYIEEKIYHPRINIESVIITNERIIFRHPHALGLKKDYTDYSYRDITNVTLDKGILRSTIKLTLKPKNKIRETNKKDHMDLDNLPNDLAEKGYGIIRENIGKFQSPFSTGYANCSQRPQIVLQQVKEEPLRLVCPKCLATIGCTLFLYAV